MIPTVNLIVTFLLMSVTNAFTTSSHRATMSRSDHSSTMQMSFFDDMGKFFDNFGSGGEEAKISSTTPSEDEMADGTYTGSKRIITIPAKTMKMGGLRLYCNLYLMGVQNTPEKGCWKASKSDDSEVNLRYVDLSGSIIIQFSEECITVDRLGSSPSNKYLMHESMILNGFLDELNAIVYEGDVSDENRLLTLPEPGNQLEQARGAISFG
ncbi:hypothetical protein ACHAXM_007152 [Skeletonema potamos]